MVKLIMNSTKKILVTGANGLLGRHLIRLLKNNGTQVYAITNSIKFSAIENVEYLHIDFSKKWCEKDLPSDVDVVIHLAQSSRFRDFPESAIDIFKVNIESTARLLEYCRLSNASKFVYASSGGVYGNGINSFTENSPIIPPGQLGYYLGSKMCGEIIAQSYANIFQVISLRFFFMYGPGQNRSMLLPRLMDNIKSKIPISLQGKSGIRINPIHVYDAAESIVSALTTEKSETFNFAGPVIYTLKEISELMGLYLNETPQFRFLNENVSDLIGNNASMISKLLVPYRKLTDHFQDIEN